MEGASLSTFLSMECIGIPTGVLLIIIFFLISSSFSLQPLSYDIYLRIPNEVASNVSFSASISIHLLLDEPSTILILNSMDLSSFRNVTLLGFDQQEHHLKGIRICEETVEFMYNTLSRGEYILHIGEYVGRIGSGSAGMFIRGQSVFTHLQPSFARRIIPCVDQPNVKAPFRISIEHSQTTTAFSNTASIEERLMGDRKLTIFGTTPSLPPYLIAFSLLPNSVIHLSGQTTFGVRVRVIGRKHSTIVRVLRSSMEAFEYVSKVMRVPLPLNKMDILLVDSYEGGMENWGHILISSEIAENGDDSHLLHLIAHELTHHWIGNIASVSSWSHICLQEDLTELIAHKTVKNIVKKEEYERFRLGKYIEIQLAEDVLSPQHPLILPSDITPQMIWTHCYLKGVIHLERIEWLIGEEEILSIIRLMITSNSTFDIFTFSSHLSRFVIKDNMTLSDVFYHSYTTGGYPTINVSVMEDTIRIDQSGSTLWPLSLSFYNGSSHWLLTNSESFHRQSNTSSLQYLVNQGFKTFMRVNYDTKTWKQILYMLEQDASQFTPVGRAQFISDLCYFSSSLVDKYMVDRVMALVNDQPDNFDLCDWSLLWCRNSQSVSVSTVLQKVLYNLSSMFTSASDYKCRSGQAIQGLNRICRTFFGRPCI